MHINVINGPHLFLELGYCGSQNRSEDHGVSAFKIGGWGGGCGYKGIRFYSIYLLFGSFRPLLLYLSFWGCSLLVYYTILYLRIQKVGLSCP